MRFFTQLHRFYCGIDLHTRSLQMCILDQTGCVVLDKNVAARLETFLLAIAPFRDDIVADVECMYAWSRRLAQIAEWSERPTPRGCPCVEPLPNGDRSWERELVVLLGRRGARTIFWGAAALAPQPVGPGKRSTGFDPLELFGAVSY